MPHSVHSHSENFTKTADRRGTQNLHNDGVLVVDVTAGDGNFFHTMTLFTVSYITK